MLHVDWRDDELQCYSTVESFFEIFPKIFKWKRRSSVTNKNGSFEKGVDSRT